MQLSALVRLAHRYQAEVEDVQSQAPPSRRSLPTISTIGTMAQFPSRYLRLRPESK